MHTVSAGIARFTEASSTPSPSPTDVDPNAVTPGVGGFVLIVILAVVVVFLVWDMMRRIRRGRYRAEVREELDAEQLAHEQADAAERDTEVDDQDIDPRKN
jgi:flagellar biosynthesis/type III secretory pathway M-ring protein FliF/YscJ